MKPQTFNDLFSKIKDEYGYSKEERTAIYGLVQLYDIEPDYLENYLTEMVNKSQYVPFQALADDFIKRIKIWER